MSHRSAAHCISAIPILTTGCFRIGRETNNWTNVHIGPTSKLSLALSPRDYIANRTTKLVTQTHACCVGLLTIAN
jgi:hypothetical protein